MNNRKSVRLNNNPPYKTGYVKKHIVVVLNMSLMENAQSWVRNKNNELADYQKKVEGTKLSPVQISQLTYYQLIDFTDLEFDDAKKSTSNKLCGIDTDIIIYLFCHGYIENTFDPDLALQINLKNPKAIEIEFSAKDLFKFLKNHGLDKNHKVLKLAACYSERFAQELSDVSKNYFPEMTIAGYYGELIVNQKCNYKYAGLVHESGYLIEKDPKQYSIINKSKIEPFREMVEFYRAHNWRYTFKKGKLIEGPLKKGAADINGFIPIQNRVPKKRKRPAQENSDEEKQVTKSQTVNLKKSKKQFFILFKSVERKEVKVTNTPKRLKRT